MYVSLTLDVQWMVLLVMEDTAQFAPVGIPGAFSFFRMRSS